MMRISEIVIQRDPLEHRHIGVRTNHNNVVELAKRVYTTLGWDPNVEYDAFWLDVPRARAQWTQGAIERCCGVPCFNDWEKP